MKRTRMKARNLEEEVVSELRRRAARHGRSGEVEHRAIQQETLLPEKEKKSLKAQLLAMPPLGEGADFERSPETYHERRIARTIDRD